MTNLGTGYPKNLVVPVLLCFGLSLTACGSPSNEFADWDATNNSVTYEGGDPLAVPAGLQVQSWRNQFAESLISSPEEPIFVGQAKGYNEAVTRLDQDKTRPDTWEIIENIAISGPNELTLTVSSGAPNCYGLYETHRERDGVIQIAVINKWIADQDTICPAYGTSHEVKIKTIAPAKQVYLVKLPDSQVKFDHRLNTPEE
ncbi:hypothetical protein BK816_02350 [Boudabousia tangfeifanii]|uniref:PrcB C-terminal domain-containing protein n=1 Tax=Boudabousia tangfeifanii TaxID=1912795 RepID=A0A1D9MJ10_9ACTO|nr:hypothetical protein [Boudabousia tangfeifanii]AOZ72284.1 hypothetical protein BK816_02350 [Boudabousia tangfeifanii]